MITRAIVAALAGVFGFGAGWLYRDRTWIRTMDRMACNAETAAILKRKGAA